MPLLGSAAMLLSFDVVDDAIEDHDDWHTHEHLPERLAIPGFLRGTRWVSWRDPPRYMVLYEVAALATLTSEAYLARLNNPSDWTRRVMPHYRGMSRGFCTVTGSFGYGLGVAATLVRFKPAPGDEATLRKVLLQETLPALPLRHGVGSAHLLEGAVTPQMTNEQRIRGADTAVDWAVIVTGYRDSAILDAVRNLGALGRHGATGVVTSNYWIDYALTCAELQP